MSDTVDQDPRCVAAHELGHAILARESGIRVGEIRVYSPWLSKGMIGYCMVKNIEPPTLETRRDRRAYKLYLAINAAGQAASEHWFRLRGEPVEFTAWADHENFLAEVAHLPERWSWDEAMSLARDVILPRWSEIEALTPRLVEKGRLDGRKVA